MTDHEFKLGDRVRTSFDGEEFPGVYAIVGFQGGGAQLESRDGDRTWCPISELNLVTDPPPGPLTERQKRRVLDFAKFVGTLQYDAAEAALTLLRALVCVHCGTPLTEKKPTCYCQRDD